MASRVCLIGVGYVGLPTAGLLARAGHAVVGVDRNPEVVRALRGEIPFDAEPDVQELLADPVVRQNLTGSAQVVAAETYIVAVPTPLENPRKTADLSMVKDACEAAAQVLAPGALVVIESTVPPGACQRVVAPILERSGLRVGRDLWLAHCPERVLPGRAVWEIVHNHRIIGAADDASGDAAAALYAGFCEGELVRCDLITAELCKLMENTYRDVNIALANELAMVCASLDVDVHRAIEIANKHPRVSFLRPGIGVGGHCIPIDPWFIAEVDPESSVLMPTARRINDAQPARIAGILRRLVADLAEPRLLLVGATYKADVYDLREAPALEIFERLRDDGYDVRLVDPLTREYPSRGLAVEAAGRDLCAILVPHRAVLEELDARRAEIAAAMRTPRLYSVAGGAAVRA
jgi:UDP-N-acetyl-D-mannosaminuronic acid dehydrogenase